MNIFVVIILGLVSGAVGGWVAGIIHNHLTWWGKDLRDSRLRASGQLLPSDRVFPHYQWPLAVFGALNAVFLSLIGLPFYLAALVAFIIPVLFLCFLMISAVLTLFGRSR